MRGSSDQTVILGREKITPPENRHTPSDSGKPLRESQSRRTAVQTRAPESRDMGSKLAAGTIPIPVSLSLKRRPVQIYLGQTALRDFRARQTAKRRDA